MVTSAAAGAPPSMYTLRTDPRIQSLVEERILQMETSVRKQLGIATNPGRPMKSGRYNINETYSVLPKLRPPDEACGTTNETGYI